MNGRKLKTGQATCRQMDRAALEEQAGGQTLIWMTERGDTDMNGQCQGLLEFILSPANLNEAYKQVKRNKGRGEFDGMQVEEQFTLSIALHKYPKC